MESEFSMQDSNIFIHSLKIGNGFPSFDIQTIFRLSERDMHLSWSHYIGDVKFLGPTTAHPSLSCVLVTMTTVFKLILRRFQGFLPSLSVAIIPVGDNDGRDGLSRKSTSDKSCDVCYRNSTSSKSFTTFLLKSTTNSSPSAFILSGKYSPNTLNYLWQSLLAHSGFQAAKKWNETCQGIKVKYISNHPAIDSQAQLIRCKRRIYCSVYFF